MEAIKILDLPLKAKWYDMQESGEKPEEYRGVTPYWCNRLLYGCPLGIKDYWEPVLEKTFEAISENGKRFPKCYNLQHQLVWQYGVRGYTHVRFRYGYTKRTFTNKIDSITIGRGRPEWGAPTDREVFIIKHHKEDSPILCHHCYECKFFSYNVMGTGFCGLPLIKGEGQRVPQQQYNKACDNFELRKYERN